MVDQADERLMIPHFPVINAMLSERSYKLQQSLDRCNVGIR